MRRRHIIIALIAAAVLVCFFAFFPSVERDQADTGGTPASADEEPGRSPETSSAIDRQDRPRPRRPPPTPQQPHRLPTVAAECRGENRRRPPKKKMIIHRKRVIQIFCSIISFSPYLSLPERSPFLFFFLLFVLFCFVFYLWSVIIHCELFPPLDFKITARTTEKGSRVYPDTISRAYLRKLWEKTKRYIANDNCLSLVKNKDDNHHSNSFWNIWRKKTICSSKFKCIVFSKFRMKYWGAKIYGKAVSPPLEK